MLVLWRIGGCLYGLFAFLFFYKNLSITSENQYTQQSLQIVK